MYWEFSFEIYKAMVEVETADTVAQVLLFPFSFRKKTCRTRWGKTMRPQPYKRNTSD